MDELARRVIAERRRQYGSVEAALRASGVNRATWLRVEDGQRVRDESLSRIETALGWPPGYAFRLADGEDAEEPEVNPSVVDDSDPIRDAIESSSLPEHDKAILLAQLDVMRSRQVAEGNEDEPRRFA